MTLIDDFMRDLLGVSEDEYERSISVKGPLPMAMFNQLVKLVDRSGVVEMVTIWDKEERKGAAGRKPLIPLRAVLVLDLMSALWGFGAHFEELARTITYRLTTEQFQALGVRWEDVPAKVWYKRVWRAKHRLLHLLDPYHATQRRKKLEAAEYALAKAAYDDVREDRLTEVAQALVSSSVKMMPQRFAEQYRGDVAIDSTFVKILGSVDSKSSSKPRRNVDFSAGVYDHSHREDAAKEAQVGYELDTVTMVDSRRQIDLDAGRRPRFFPQLITGVGFHRPAEITRHPLLAMRQHTAMFPKVGVFIADRAFNNLHPDNFQMPLRLLGWEAVYDYRLNQLGHQATVPDAPVIMVDGQLYVEYMPVRLRHMTEWYAKKEEDPETGRVPTFEDRADAIAARAAYALKPHGRADADGYQRYTYPDPRGYMAFDPATGKRVRSTLRGSITIPPQPQIIKHLQRYPWKSDTWWQVYGQRNHVESSNKNLKDVRGASLAEPKLRAIRGYAAQFLNASVAVVATNLRRIVAALRTEAAENAKPRTRKPRRPNVIVPRDERGRAIPASGAAPPA